MGYYHIPIRSGEGGATFHLDTSADTLADTHGRVRQSFTINEGDVVVQDLTIGLYDGGSGEADLSGIAETPDVGFVSQIQPIFNTSCIACHAAGATNSGGLNLESAVAFAQLVGLESAEAPGVKRVQAGSPEDSYLMEKINASTPQVGTSMRPGDPMPLAQRALIRDWIKQLGDAGTIQFTSATYSVQEKSSPRNLAVGVSRTGGSTGAVSVEVASISGGSATEGSDYTAVSQTLSWENGDAQDKSFDVSIAGDTLAEGPETVLLQLDNLTGGALAGTVMSTAVTIQDRPVDAWRSSYFGPEADSARAQPAADFDGDGVANLIEYALGGDPTLPDPRILPVASLPGDRHLHFDFSRSLVASGIGLDVTASASLRSDDWDPIATWRESSGWMYVTGAQVTEDPSTGEVRITDPVSISDTDRRFIRLEIIRTD